jgi:hypothetical protein
MDEVALDIPNFPISILISGPTEMGETGTAQFTAIVSNLSRPDNNVSSRNVWSVDPPTAGNISSAGLFTPSEVNSDRSVTIRAAYTEAGITVEDEFLVVVLNVEVNTPIIDVTLAPSVDPSSLFIGQTFSVDVSVATDGDPVPNIRLLQLDTSLTSGVQIDAINWDFVNLSDSSLYFQFLAGNVQTATYISPAPVPGFVVDLTSTPQKVAQIDVTFLGDGSLNLLGAANPPNSNESIRFQSGFNMITEFAQEKSNVTGGTLDLTEGNVPLTILSTVPPTGSIDARQPSELDGSNPAGWQAVDISFTGPVDGLNPGNFEVSTDGGRGTGPTVLSVTPLDLTTVQVVLSDPIEPGVRTTITYMPTGSGVTLGYLPADVNGDGTSGPIDILALIDHLNGVGASLTLWATDINRSGEANATDIVRLIDLLNGADAYDVWNGVSLP